LRSNGLAARLRQRAEGALLLLGRLHQKLHLREREEVGNFSHHH
jgi:hypothetical protein